MYSKEFAKVYNDDWADFSKTLVPLVLKKVKKRGSLLDVGCGTGNFLQEMEKHYGKCVGIDISPNMVQVAKDNCKESEIVIGNMLDFDLGETFDLITCNFDTINHLDSLEEWKVLFVNVRRHLAKGGTFIFDFNTIFKMGALAEKGRVRETEKYNIESKDKILDKNHALITFKIFDKNGKLIADIDQIESFYDAATVMKALLESGFKSISFADYDLKKTDNLESKRLFVICK